MYSYTCDYRQNSYKTPSKSNKVVATTTEKSFNDRVLLGPEVIVNCGVTHLDGPLTSCWGLMLIIVCLLLSFSLRADCYYLICCLMVNGMFSHWCGIFGKVRICAPVKKFKMKDFGYYQICNLHNISTTTIPHTKRVTLTYWTSVCILSLPLSLLSIQFIPGLLQWPWFGNLLPHSCAIWCFIIWPFMSSEPIYCLLFCSEMWISLYYRPITHLKYFKLQLTCIEHMTECHTWRIIPITPGSSYHAWVVCI